MHQALTSAKSVNSRQNNGELRKTGWGCPIPARCMPRTCARHCTECRCWTTLSTSGRLDPTPMHRTHRCVGMRLRAVTEQAARGWHVIVAAGGRRHDFRRQRRRQLLRAGADRTQHVGRRPVAQPGSGCGPLPTVPGRLVANEAIGAWLGAAPVGTASRSGHHHGA